ncbi:MAG: hypothetical protein U0796_04000 [Gemmatales bacterium]
MLPLFLLCLLPSDDVLQSWKHWLQASSPRPALEVQAWSRVPLSRHQAQAAQVLLVDQQQARLREERAEEWKQKQIDLNQLTMRFAVHVYGEKPAQGRSLYISLHGGGNSGQRVNNQQWENQKKLYQPAEGVYIAPRAPNDAWDMWFQSHMDAFFARLIEDAVLFADVDVNRVYLMGYSAGGDGVFRLATRLADRWAAAAMMAGHPGDVRPDNLRNLPFALYMGGKDSAYERNKRAEEWKSKLATLQQGDPSGYPHQVVIFPEYGHWMQRKDAAAVPWMAKQQRQTVPPVVVWQSPQPGSFYWLADVAVEEGKQKQARIEARVKGQVIQLHSEHVNQLTLRLRDDLVNLDQPVTVEWDGKEVFSGKVPRTLQGIHSTWTVRLDAGLIYPAGITVNKP